MKIAEVDLKGTSNKLTLHVTAIAPTFGWQDVGLSQVEHITPPEDGLQVIVLFATPPVGPVATSVEIFPLSLELGISDWFQGVKLRDTLGNQIWSLRNPTLKQVPIGTSSFFMEPISTDGDKLLIHVRYGGGCKNHSFQLNWDGEIMKSQPVQVVLELTHNNNGDTCKALLSETLQYDLSTLQGFPQQEMVIILQSPGRSFELDYTPSNSNNAGNLVSENGGGVVGNG